MEKVKDLKELVKLSEKDLEDILENDANAGLLWSFLHSQLQLASNNSTASKSKTRK